MSDKDRALQYLVLRIDELKYWIRRYKRTKSIKAKNMAQMMLKEVYFHQRLAKKILINNIQ